MDVLRPEIEPLGSMALEDSEEEEHRRLWEEQGKTEINALVWKWAPNSITLKEADQLACTIYDLIQKAFNRPQAGR